MIDSCSSGITASLAQQTGLVLNALLVDHSRNYLTKEPITFENSKKRQRKKKTLELNHIGHFSYQETFNVLTRKQAIVLIRDKLLYLISTVQQQPQQPSVRAHRKWFAMTTLWGAPKKFRWKKESALGQRMKSRELCWSPRQSIRRRNKEVQSQMTECTRYVCFFSPDNQQTSSTVVFILRLESFHRFEKHSNKYCYKYCNFLHQKPTFEYVSETKLHVQSDRFVPVTMSFVLPWHLTRLIAFSAHNIVPLMFCTYCLIHLIQRLH